MYFCMYECMTLSAHVYCLCKSLRKCTSTHICTCVYVFMYLCIVYMYAFVYVDTHICMTYACLRICR